MCHNWDQLIALISRIPPFLTKFSYAYWQLDHCKILMPLMWEEGLLKGGQSWQASMDSLAIDMVTRMAHSAFVNSLFLGSTISKHIYTLYPVILCACFILQWTTDLLKTVASYWKLFTTELVVFCWWMVLSFKNN